MGGKLWTESEDNYLRENYPDMSCKEISEQMNNRDCRSVMRRCSSLGLKRPTHTIKVGDIFGKLKVIELFSEKKYSANKNIFYAKCKCECGNIVDIKTTELNCDKRKDCGCVYIETKLWSEEEERILRENFASMTNKEVGELLGRTEEAVARKLSKLNLTKPSKVPIIGQKYGKLEVLEIFEMFKYGSHRNIARCKCDCGRTKDLLAANVFNGDRTDCGCGQREFVKNLNYKHGKSKFGNSKIYGVWMGMKNRCYNTKMKSYKNYGARGIIVCDEWKNDFCEFEKWALAHGYEDDLSIDRIDNDGNYCPENCRWATAEEQSKNTRRNIWIEAFGERKVLGDWVQDPRCKVGRYGLKKRIQQGWSSEQAITTPPREKPNGEQPC